MLSTESRMRGDMQVRFGGRYGKTYCRKAVRRSVPSLRLCITLIFTFRFFVEFLKERQVDFENALPIDMGQILSIPFIVVGLYFVFRKNHSAHV